MPHGRWDAAQSYTKDMEALRAGLAEDTRESDLADFHELRQDFNPTAKSATTI